jgi:hypothetical protein
VGLAGTALGVEYNMAVTTAGMRLGQLIMGPKIDAQDLKGRVVLLEFWGIN